MVSGGIKPLQKTALAVFCDILMECLTQSAYTAIINIQRGDFCKNMRKIRLGSLFFTFGGALVGLICCDAAGCATGSCTITSTLGGTMAYMALLGFLVSVIFQKGGCCNCQKGLHVTQENEKDET